ncbi:MAG: DUF255 domain-containing protein [Saprospiraceae bacterium]|nr:DUF255 domain-containing protein [Saprospiraceae bacterium]
MRVIFFFCFLLFAVAAKAQKSTPTAQEVLKEAYMQAEKENKKVFVIFHASWCGWCKRMDAAMQDESCKDFFQENFVITHLTVQESPDNKKLENKGGDIYVEQWGGKELGLPFWAILDVNGALLANSLDAKGDNIGCPAQVHEVEAFISILQKTTSIDTTTAAAITKRFKQNAR